MLRCKFLEEQTVKYVSKHGIVSACIILILTLYIPRIVIFHRI